MIARDARQFQFFAKCPFDYGATDFSNEFPTLAVKSSTRAAFVLGVSFALREPNPKNCGNFSFEDFVTPTGNFSEKLLYLTFHCNKKMLECFFCINLFRRFCDTDRKLFSKAVVSHLPFQQKNAGMFLSHNSFSQIL